ncbi:hypothetical protein [Leptothermofonsia sp. ETS-13]|uniref:hypothetical protein n=1 Tax=Leptothermofonsia sp. ETS-13 TaxID=3035696 RepID=UPI003B9DF658
MQPALTSVMHTIFTTSPGDDNPSQLAAPFTVESIGKQPGLKPDVGLSTPPSGRSRPLGLQKNWALLRKLHRATLIARQQGLLLPKKPESEATPDGLAELKQAAEQGEIQKSRLGLRGGEGLTRSTQFTQPGGHAAPLLPLRERDAKVLSDWFQRDDMLEVEADIASCLLRLLPEPCWEDDLFEFVRDFL